MVTKDPAPNWLAAPRRVGKQRREPQHLPVDGDMVDLDATLDEQLLDVAVGQAEA